MAVGSNFLHVLASHVACLSAWDSVVTCVCCCVCVGAALRSQAVVVRTIFFMRKCGNNFFEFRSVNGLELNFLTLSLHRLKFIMAA
jgi:hypothetical protein